MNRLALLLSFCGLLSAQSVTLEGPSVNYAGSPAWVAIVATGVPGKTTRVEVAAPPGATWTAWSGARAMLKAPLNKQTGQIVMYNGPRPTTILLKLEGLPAGSHSVSVHATTAAEDFESTVEHAVNVVPLPSPSASKQVSSAASVARAPSEKAVDRAISDWEYQMVTMGKRNCKPDDDFGSFGYDGSIAFYDGARVFFQIADYTGDKSWEACAFNIASQWANFVIRVNGAIPGWRVFTRGLRMAYDRTGEERYKTAIGILATRSNAAVAAGTFRVHSARETAYALDAYVDAEIVGFPRNPYMPIAVDYILWHFDGLFRTGNYDIHQTFLDGLEAHALIAYYDHTKDPRVLPTIKLLADWVDAKGYNRKNNQLIYNPDPPGPTCPNSCQKYHSNLMNLVIPALAWYARETGDTKVRDLADEMFRHSFDEGIWGGKQFSQQFRWSFDYVKWRYDRTRQRKN